MLTAIIIPLLVACGGDDENEDILVDLPTEERSEAIKELCNMFGINADDYYDFWWVCSKDDKVAISLANKKTSKLFVAIYDRTKKSVVYSNSDIYFTTSINTSYFDKSFNGKIIEVSPRFAKTRNGFIINALVKYNESGDRNNLSDVAMCIQNIYFFDGKTTKTKQFPASSNYFDEIYSWYDDSCIFYCYYYNNSGRYSCYTDKGEEIFADKYISTDDRYALSYNEYINIDDKKTFRRLDVLNPNKNGDRITNTVWSNEIKLIDNYSSDVKVTHTIEDRTSSNWSLSSKFVWEDGTTKVVQWRLNTETGEYKIK